MKTQYMLIGILLIFLTLNCANQNKAEEKDLINTVKQQKIEKIQLTEISRGIHRNSVFTSTYKTAVFNNDSTRIAMTPSEWENIAKEAEALDLSKISKLQSPTTGRYSDQALSSTLIITSGGTTYTSATFDSGNPPKELKALYNRLQQPKKSKKENP